MPTESPFFTEDFIRRYEELYPRSDDRIRMWIYGYLESPEPVTTDQLRFIQKYSDPPYAMRMAYFIDVQRVHQALEKGGDALDELRPEIQEKLEQIEWLKKAEKLDRELSSMLWSLIESKTT